jgi:hypothetical protein
MLQVRIGVTRKAKCDSLLANSRDEMRRIGDLILEYIRKTV